MKHILICKLNPDDASSTLVVMGLVPFDERSAYYDPETKGFKEHTYVDWITYVDVEDGVEVDANYIATQNSEGGWSFSKP